MLHLNSPYRASLASDGYRKGARRLGTEMSSEAALDAINRTLLAPLLAVSNQRLILEHRECRPTIASL